MGASGEYGDASLSDGIAEYAKTHVESESASLTFQNDADQITTSEDKNVLADLADVVETGHF